MIKFKAKHLVNRGYSQHLDGNGGEEELIIITSWGQDRKTSLVIVAVTIDGGVTVLHTGTKRVILANVLAVLDRVINSWSRRGIKPTPEELEVSTKQRKKVLDRLVCLYETGEIKLPKTWFIREQDGVTHGAPGDVGFATKKAAKKALKRLGWKGCELVTDRVNN